MVRKREKTETVGTGFGMPAAVEEAGGAAVAGDGLIEAEAVRCEELLSWVPAERAEESSVTLTEARLASGC